MGKGEGDRFILRNYSYVTVEAAMSDFCRADGRPETQGRVDVLARV